MGSSPATPEPVWERPELLRLLGNLPGMAYRCRNDSDWTMEFVSAGCRDLIGAPARDLIRNRVVSYGDLIHADDRERVWKAVQAALEVGEPFRLTYRIRRVDGEVRWVWEQGTGVVGPDGAVDFIEGFITDITEREELADRVEERESQFQALVEQSMIGVYVIRDGRFLYLNRRIAQLFGYSLDEMLSLPSIADVIHPDDRALVGENLRRRVAGEVETVRYEFRGVRKDGQVFDVEVQGRRIELDDGPAVMGLLLDITERKVAQRRYHEARKAEALAELASGVAHDFNNILASIGVVADLLSLDAEGQAATDLADIQEAVRRGAKLCQRLMSFGARRPKDEPSASVGEVLSDLTPILERLLARRQVRLLTALADGLPRVRVDSGQLEQVAMNLVLNAGDATPEGGEVELRGRLEEEPDVPRVILEVRDRGTGIAPEHLERIFEPYFTTKGDMGNGLGLRNVWNIVTDSGGEIRVDSELGNGSTFYVLLPVERRQVPRT